MNSKTQVLLLEVSRIFETFDYKMNPVLSIDEFYKAAIKKLNRADSISDAEIIINAILRFGKLFNEFVKALADKENLKYFNELKLLPLQVNYLDEDKAKDIHILTNALTPDYRRFFMTNLSYDGEHIEFNVKFHKVKGVYYWASIPFGKSHNSVDIYDNSNNLILSLAMKGKRLVQVNDDVINLSLVDKKDVIKLYERDSYNIKDKKNKNEQQVEPIAVIESKLITHPNQIGIARYRFLNIKFDKELIDFICLAKLVLSRKR